MLVLLLVYIIAMAFLKLWVRAFLADCHIPIGVLIVMQIRTKSAVALVDSYIMARKSGAEVDIAELEALKLAGGDVESAVKALAMAQHAGLDTDFAALSKVEMAGGEGAALLRQAVSERDPKLLKRTLGNLKPQLNLADFTGRSGEIAEAFYAHGRVRVEGHEFEARFATSDSGEGTKVVVVGVEGAKLIVEIKH